LEEEEGEEQSGQASVVDEVERDLELACLELLGPQGLGHRQRTHWMPS
jgi:hypothetical protein